MTRPALEIRLSLVTAHSSLEIRPFSGPQHLIDNRIRCLPAHLYTQLTETDTCYSVMWLSLRSSTSHNSTHKKKKRGVKYIIFMSVSCG
jgi:hypothetical protein